MKKFIAMILCLIGISLFLAVKSEASTGRLESKDVVIQSAVLTEGGGSGNRAITLLAVVDTSQKAILVSAHGPFTCLARATKLERIDRIDVGKTFFTGYG